MKTIRVSKFDPFDFQVSEGATIVIDDQLPTSAKDLGEVQDFYAEQARLIATTLFDTLPQGTFDRLLAEIIKIKASLYRGKTES